MGTPLTKATTNNQDSYLQFSEIHRRKLRKLFSHLYCSIQFRLTYRHSLPSHHTLLQQVCKCLWRIGIDLLCTIHQLKFDKTSHRFRPRSRYTRHRQQTAEHIFRSNSGSSWFRCTDHSQVRHFRLDNR